MAKLSVQSADTTDSSFGRSIEPNEIPARTNESRATKRRDDKLSIIAEAARVRRKVLRQERSDGGSGAVSKFKLRFIISPFSFPMRAFDRSLHIYIIWDMSRGGRGRGGGGIYGPRGPAAVCRVCRERERILKTQRRRARLIGEIFADEFPAQSFPPARARARARQHLFSIVLIAPNPGPTSIVSRYRDPLGGHQPFAAAVDCTSSEMNHRLPVLVVGEPLDSSSSRINSPPLGKCGPSKSHTHNVAVIQRSILHSGALYLSPPLCPLPPPHAGLTS